MKSRLKCSDSNNKDEDNSSHVNKVNISRNSNRKYKRKLAWNFQILAPKTEMEPIVGARCSGYSKIVIKRMKIKHKNINSGNDAK